MSKNIYHFFVEGEGERAIINTLKTELQCIQAGKVECYSEQIEQKYFNEIKTWNDCHFGV